MKRARVEEAVAAAARAAANAHAAQRAKEEAVAASPPPLAPREAVRTRSMFVDLTVQAEPGRHLEQVSRLQQELEVARAEAARIRTMGERDRQELVQLRAEMPALQLERDTILATVEELKRKVAKGTEASAVLSMVAVTARNAALLRAGANGSSDLIVTSPVRGAEESEPDDPRLSGSQFSEFRRDEARSPPSGEPMEQHELDATMPPRPLVDACQWTSEDPASSARPAYTALPIYQAAPVSMSAPSDASVEPSSAAAPAYPAAPINSGDLAVTSSARSRQRAPTTPLPRPGQAASAVFRPRARQSLSYSVTPTARGGLAGSEAMGSARLPVQLPRGLRRSASPVRLVSAASQPNLSCVSAPAAAGGAVARAAGQRFSAPSPRPPMRLPQLRMPIL